MWIQATGKYTTQDLESDRETDGAMFLLSTAEKQQFMQFERRTCWPIMEFPCARRKFIVDKVGHQI